MSTLADVGIVRLGKLCVPAQRRLLDPMRPRMDEITGGVERGLLDNWNQSSVEPEHSKGGLLECGGWTPLWILTRKA